MYMVECLTYEDCAAVPDKVCERMMETTYAKIPPIETATLPKTDILKA